MKVNIVHVHSDYPDGRKGYPYTRAVENLINSTHEVNHFVVSINRTANPLKISLKKIDNGVSVVYWCIPFSYLYSFGLWILSIWMKLYLSSLNADIVHGHKITTDGVIAHAISKKLNAKLMLSLRGGTDLSNIKKHNFYNKKFKDVVSYASHIFLVSPWAKNEVESLLHLKITSSSKLPNICKIDNITYNDKAERSVEFFSVLSFHQYKRKGILDVFHAIKVLSENGLNIYLDVYGDGPSEAKLKITKIIQDLGLSGQVKLKGNVEHDYLLNKITDYAGLLLPAVNETFGMIYIETLACGVPIMYHKDTGIDGYFNEELGVCVSDRSPLALAESIKVMKEKSDIYNQNIRDYIRSGMLNQYTQVGVVNNYKEIVCGLSNAKA